MDLRFERIQSGSNRHLQSLMALYIASFPPEERRTSSDLLRMLNDKDMYFAAVIEEDMVLGLVVYWKFLGFVYLEHLAILTAFRNKGFGEGVLKQLKKEGFPILLEVEIPYDENSSRRVGFYHRSGFSALPVYYHQPPYREGESAVPMMLFSDKSDWDPKLLAVSTELFQKKVYFQKK